MSNSFIKLALVLALSFILLPALAFALVGNFVDDELSTADNLSISSSASSASISSSASSNNSSISSISSSASSASLSTTRDYAFEHYCDSLYVNDYDYYIDVLVETDEYQEYVDKHGQW